MRSLLAILLWVLSWGIGQGLQAQDLSGQWTGTASNNGSDTRQKIVLTITESDSAIAGVLHWYSPETQYIRHLIIGGRFYGKDSVLTIREDSAGDAAAGFHVLYYRRTPGRRDILEGHWTTATGAPAGKAANLAIRLEKKAPPFIPFALPKKKKDSAQLKALFDRETPVVATIPIRGVDTVKVELYDNGEIDGDSVSLYLNNDLLLQHYKLTAEAKVLLVPIDKSLPVNRLVLFAENLGRLPPNTALMEVTVHGKRYDLFLSTDFRRNACVEFALQE
ncbi:MAG TPA: hypothetical protein VFE32_09775 [Puia sp.]|jgi:hypothetical protein|nr:hypothetical protein [Puia sp.]